MSTEQAFSAALEILKSGGWIEQIRDCLIQYTLRLGSESAALPGHIVQRLLHGIMVQPSSCGATFRPTLANKLAC
ncbi:hypothetical protein [Thiomonas sp.]